MEQTGQQKLNVVLLGYGRIGLVHAESITRHPRLNLLAIVGSNEKKVSEIAKKFGTRGALSLATILNEEKVDGVVIASPTLTHPDYIKLCAQKSIPVFTEKPVAFLPDQISECFQLAHKANIPLVCGFQRRFDPAFVKVKESMDQAVGEPHLLLLTSRDHPPPSTDFLAGAGTLFQDVSSHDIDAARWYFGEEPELIFGTASSLVPECKGVDDTCVIVLRFPSGGLCVINNSRRTTYGYDIRAEVLGSKGMLQIANPPVLPVIHASADGLVGELAPFSFPERFVDGYRNELGHWVDMVDKKQLLSDKVTQQDCEKTAQYAIDVQHSRQKQRANVEGKFSMLPKEEVYHHHYDTFKTHTPGRVGFILFGVGRMGTVRAHAVLANRKSDLFYAVDIHEPSVAKFAEEYHCKGLLLSNATEALKDERVDAVVISVNSPAHFEVIMMAVAAGKAVFCEKPLALSSAETRQCLVAAEKNKVPIYCGFQRRWDPNFLRLKTALEENKVEVVHITSRDGATHNSASYLASSGGFFFDSLIHDFDEARWLTGEDPVEVYCTGSAFIPEIKGIGDVDVVVVVLRFPSGAIAHIDNHRRAVYGYDQRAEVHTSKGVYKVNNEMLTTFSAETEKGVSTETPSFNGLLRYEKAYKNEIDHFIGLLLQEVKEPRVLPEDPLKGALIAEAAKESLRTKERIFL